MKFAWIVLLIFPALTQIADSRQLQNDPDRDVAAFLKMWESGIVSGPIPNYVNREGDAAAVALTRVISGRVLSPTEVRGCLAVLASAFARPLIVNNKLDREPRTALFVLGYLDSVTTDKELKRVIAATKSAIQQHALEAANNPELDFNVTGNPDRSNVPERCCGFISEALHAVAQIKPGMTRAEVEQTFRQDGGLSEHADARYLYRSCESIKVKILFKLTRAEQRSGDDIVVSVGQPYLEPPIGD